MDAKTLKNIKLSKHFTAYEFCNKKDGYAIKVPNPELFTKLEELREVIGEPIEITSGFRTEKFNKKIGGSVNSYHLKGLAVDIKFDFCKWNIEVLLKILSSIGFHNCGIYVNNCNQILWLHLDMGKRWENWKNYNDMAYKIWHK